METMLTLHVNPQKFKVHSLTGRITPALLADAFRAVKRNRGAAGIDRVSISLYEINLAANQWKLLDDLKQRRYQPQPLRRVFIPKGQGKFRPLGIPTVRDRVAQEVVRRLLTPVFEALFQENSFGFRPGRDCHQAVGKVLSYMEQGFQWVIDADIKGFFDAIPHHLIMRMVSAEIADGNILTLIEKFLRSGVMEEGVRKPTVSGTPQGGVISPLLANIVLNHLDWRLHAQGCKFVRYADDFVVLCKSRAEAEKALELVRLVIETELELELHPEKTKILPLWQGFDFLGFHISSRTVKMRAKSRENFKTKIRLLTPRHRNLDEQCIGKLNRVIRGTVNYFSTTFSTTADQFDKLDRWLRKRVRCMKFKRISHRDNFRLKNQHLDRLGLLRGLNLSAEVKERRRLSPNQTRTVIGQEQSHWGRPVRESRTLVNMGN